MVGSRINGALIPDFCRRQSAVEERRFVVVDTFLQENLTDQYLPRWDVPLALIDFYWTICNFFLVFLIFLLAFLL
jgi:hypothetical protein